MNINVDNNSIVQAGIAQLQKGNHNKALGLFCNADSYESYLNQLGCLFYLGENYYAVEIYHKILAVYYGTHNVLCDIARLGGGVLALVELVDGDFKPRAPYDQNKISAQSHLLGDFQDFEPNLFDLFGDQSSQEMEDFFNNQFAPKKATVFFDIKSPNYLRDVYGALCDAYQTQDFEQVKRLGKLLLQGDSCQQDVLEMQLSLCLFQEKYKRGCQIVGKLAGFDNLSAECVSDAVEVLSHKASTCKDLVQNFLLRAQKLASQLAVDTLSRCVELATNCLGDYLLALDFSKVLFANPNADIQTIKLCCYAFFNAREKQLLKQSLVAIRQRLQNDIFVKSMFYYLETKSEGKKIFKIPDKLSLHLQIPQPIVSLARTHFMYADTGNLTFESDQDYMFLAILMEQSKYFGIVGKFNDYAKYTSTVRVVLDYFVPTDKQKMQKFLLEQLSKMYPEPSLVGLFDGIISALAKLGCQKVTVIRARDNKVQTLDFSQITQGDQLFWDAFALCSTLGELDVDKMQRAYLELGKLPVKLDTSIATIRQTAYYLFKMTIKTPVADVEQLFVDQDTLLYKQYKKFLRQQLS